MLISINDPSVEVFSLHLRPLTNLDKAYYIIQGKLLKSKSTDLNINHIYKVFTAISELVFDQTRSTVVHLKGHIQINDPVGEPF